MNYLEPVTYAHGGEWDLYDVVEGRLEEDRPDDGRGGPSAEYAGFVLVPTGRGDVRVQPDGFGGSLGLINPDDFDDVLELSTRLCRLGSTFWHELTQEERRERAGPEFTSDPERGEQDGFLFIPRDRPDED